MRPRVDTAVICSAVSGGPIRELADSLTRSGLATDIVYSLEAHEWRAAMSSRRKRLTVRVLVIAWFPLRALWQLHRKGRRGLVIATTNPFTLPPVLVAFRRLHRRPVAVLVYDLYPDALEPLLRRTWIVGNVIRLVTAELTRYTFRHASVVVFIGQQMARHAIEKYGQPRAWTIIETGAAVADFGRPGPPASVDGPFGADFEDWRGGRRLLSYVGNLGTSHDWETAAKAISRIADDGGPVELCVVVAASGPGAQEWQQYEASRASEAYIRFVGAIADDADWRSLLTQTDVSIVSLSNTASYSSMPSKVYSALAASTAILAITPPNSDLACLIQEHGCGAAASPGDIDAAVAAIRSMLVDDDALRCVKARSLRAAEEHYDSPLLAKRWVVLATQLQE